MSGRFEVLEHTADVGLRLTGSTLEEVFEAAGQGLASLLGAWFPGLGESRAVEIHAGDREQLLAAWLDELLYLQETEDIVFGGFAVDRVGDSTLVARVSAAPRAGRELEGLGIKAATYHRLRVDRENGGWVADVYLDV